MAREDAFNWHKIRAISYMGRGVDRVLMHLYLEPLTLADLYAAMFAEKEEMRKPDSDSAPTDYVVRYSLLYDVAQLAMEHIVEAEEDGKIHITCPEVVRVFLEVVVVSVQRELSPSFKTALLKKLQDESSM